MNLDEDVALYKRDLAQELMSQQVLDLRAQLAASQAECEVLRKDAERYRWLRDAPHAWQIGPWIGYEDIDHNDGAELDAAIDASRKEKK